MSNTDSSGVVPFFVRSRSLKVAWLCMRLDTDQFTQVIDRFTECLDDQSLKPAYFRNIGRDLWSKFIDKQVENVISRSFPNLNFTVATGEKNGRSKMAQINYHAIYGHPSM